MPTTKVPAAKTTTDTKYAGLVFLVLAAVIISGLNLAWSMSKDQDARHENNAIAPTTTTPTSGQPVTNNNTPPTPTPEPEFASLLEKKPQYPLPFGAAEIEAYYTKIERGTTLDESGPKVTCSALVVVDGPELLMKSLADSKFFGTPLTVVVGSGDSVWTGVNDSTKENPVKLLVTVGSAFEGEAVGCTSVTFNTFIPVE